MNILLSSSQNKKPNQLDKLLGGLNNLPSSSVMDPITIISTIGAVGAVANSVCSLSLKLYTFIEDTKNINQAVTDLVEEVNALNSILETVKSGLESDLVKLAEQRANSEDSRLLWESIQGSLINCQSTIDRLEKAVADVRPEGKNFAKQAVRRIKLNLKDTELTSFRTQIRTHTNTLQMALQMVNLRAAYLAPGAVTDELGPRIDELRAIMELVHGSEADLKAKSLGVEPDFIKGLQRSAQRVISGATTVSAYSEAAGSLWGDVMDDEKRNKTLSWIQEPAIHEEHDEPSTAAPLSDDYAFSQSTALTDYSASNAGEADSDSDGDFDSEVVETAFARGTKKFNDGNFAEAQPILQRGLQLAGKLPLKRKQPAQIAEVKLKIATCLYHSTNLSEAEAKLFAITREMIHENVTDEGAIRRCQASHLLAGVLFRQGRYEPAKSFCRKALIGRRRVLGKDHISHYESLSLLSQICEAHGQMEDAETYWAMIPDDVASKLVKMKDQFPDLQQGQSRALDTSNLLSNRLSTGEISPNTPVSSDTNEFPTPIPNSQFLSPATSPRLSTRAVSPPSRDSTLPRQATVLPYNTTLTPTFTQSSTSIATDSTAASSSAAETPMPRKRSIFNSFRRRKTSVPSITSTAPTEVSVIQEEGGDTGFSGQAKPPPRRGTSGSGSAGPRRQSFLEYLEERENQKDEGTHWPGLN
jgi:hypothetical protein